MTKETFESKLIYILSFGGIPSEGIDQIINLKEKHCLDKEQVKQAIEELEEKVKKDLPKDNSIRTAVLLNFKILKLKLLNLGEE